MKRYVLKKLQTYSDCGIFSLQRHNFNTNTTINRLLNIHKKE